MAEDRNKQKSERELLEKREYRDEKGETHHHTKKKQRQSKPSGSQ